MLTRADESCTLKVIAFGNYSDGGGTGGGGGGGGDGGGGGGG